MACSERSRLAAAGQRPALAAAECNKPHHRPIDLRLEPDGPVAVAQEAGDGCPVRRDDHQVSRAEVLEARWVVPTLIVPSVCVPLSEYYVWTGLSFRPCRVHSIVCQEDVVGVEQRPRVWH